MKRKIERVSEKTHLLRIFLFNSNVKNVMIFNDFSDRQRILTIEDHESRERDFKGLTFDQINYDHIDLWPTTMMSINLIQYTYHEHKIYLLGNKKMFFF